MSNNFDDLPYISVPPEVMELVGKNVEALKLSEISLPYPNEQAEYLNKLYKDMANSAAPILNSVSPEVMELGQKMAQSMRPIKDSFPEGFIKNIQTLNKIFGDLSKTTNRFSRKESLSKEEKTKVVKEVLNQNASESLPKTLEKSSEVIQKVNWDEIDQLEDDDEVPSHIAKLVMEDPLYNQVQGISGSNSGKVTKKKLLEFSDILKMLIPVILSGLISLGFWAYDVQTAKINSQIEQERFEEQMKLENDQKQLLEKILDAATNTCEAPKSIENPASPILESLSQDNDLDRHDNSSTKQEE